MNFIKTKKGKIIIAISAVVIVAAAVIAVIFGLNAGRGYRSISVAELFGKVTATNKGASYEAYRDMKLFDGYTLETDADSYSRLVLDGEKYIKLEQKSLAVFEKLGRIGNDVTAIRLERGAMTNELTKPLGGEERYVVNTPNAVLAVRGTFFRVEVSFADDGEAFSDVYVYGGTVVCTRVMPDGTMVDEEVEIPAGYKARIKMDEIITVYVEELIEEGCDEIDPLSKSKINDGDIVDIYVASDSGHEMFLSTEELWEEINHRGIDVDEYTSQYDNGRIPHFDGYKDDPSSDKPQTQPMLPESTPQITGSSNDTDGTDKPSGDRADISHDGAPATPAIPMDNDRREPLEIEEPNIEEGDEAEGENAEEIPDENSDNESAGNSDDNLTSNEELTAEDDEHIIDPHYTTTPHNIATPSIVPDTTQSSTTAATTPETTLTTPETTATTPETTVTTPETTATSPETTTTTSETTTTTTTAETTSITTAATTTRRQSYDNSSSSDTHTHIWTTETQPSTCTEKGYEKIYCADCGKVKSTTTLDLAEHTAQTVTTPATCTEAGLSTVKCSVCGYVISETEIEPNGHTEVTEITEPTVDTTGRKLVHCSVCEKILEDTELPKFALYTDDGDIVITSTGYSVGGTDEVAYTGKYVITQRSSEPVDAKIHVSSGTHEILMNGVNIENTRYNNAAIMISDGADVKIDSTSFIAESRTALAVSGALEICSGQVKFIGDSRVNIGTLTISGGNVEFVAENPYLFEIRRGSYIQNGGVVSCGEGGIDSYSTAAISGGSFSADYFANAGSAEITGGSVCFASVPSGSNTPTNGYDVLSCTAFTDYPADKLNITRGDGTAYTYILTADDTIGGKYYVWLPAVDIDSVFTDDVFRAYVSANFDTDNDGVLSEAEIASATEIDVSGTDSADGGISSLKGVECFTALKTLKCRYNANVTDINVSALANLKTLNVSNTGITAIDVSRNTALKELFCSNTGISALSLEENSELVKLHCGSTNITALDLWSNTKLEELSCGNTAISALDFLTGLPNLKGLWCSNTSVIVLNLGGSPALEILHCDGCPITDLMSLNLNPALKEINCSNTKIKALVLDNNTALEYLNAQNASLMYLNTDGTALNTVYVDGNVYEIPSNSVKFTIPYTYMDFSKVTIQSGADYDSTTGTFSNITGDITYTYDCGNGFSETFKLSLTGEPLSGVAVNAANFPDAVFREFLLENYDDDNNDFLTDSEIASVKRIGITNSSLTSLKGIEYFTELHTLTCYSNAGLTEIDVSKNTSLRYLRCSETAIQSLDVSNNTELQSLFCDNTSITELDLSNNSKLVTLECDSSSISTLNLKNCTALSALICNDTSLSSLDLSDNTALHKLSCNNTSITDLNIENNLDLIQLDCSNTSISSLDVSKHTALTTLNCSITQISSLDVSNNTALKYLYCYETSIDELNIANNLELEWLNCYNTLVSSLDVSNNTALINLNCSVTQISSLDVSKNTALEALYCYNTSITKLDVTKNTALNDLRCYNTSITELDVSNNTALTMLLCYITNLPYIDVTANTAITTFETHGCSYPISATATEFDISIIDGMDKSKISNASGADYDSTTGIFSNIAADIKYTYDCGNGHSETFTLTRTL